MPERIDYSQTIVDKLISTRKVSELIVSFKKKLIKSRMSTQILIVFVRVETRLLYFLSVNQLNLLAQRKGTIRKIEYYVQ